MLRVPAAFQPDRIDYLIVEVQRLENGVGGRSPLDPSRLLGESMGRREANQTSPDAAYFLGLEGGSRGLAITEKPCWVMQTWSDFICWSDGA